MLYSIVLQMLAAGLRYAIGTYCNRYRLISYDYMIVLILLIIGGLAVIKSSARCKLQAKRMLSRWQKDRPISSECLVLSWSHSDRACTVDA